MKIFGIGLSKTGTSSLASALGILGYKVKDYPGIDVYKPGDLSSIEASLLEEYDALTDTPIPSFYKELDKAFPGAKFILTVRDKDAWLRSCAKQFTDKLAARQNEAHNRLFMDLYGTTVFDAEKLSQGYDRFVSGVLEYFKNRTNDLLVMNIAGGDGWEKLCPFLGMPTPERPFPKANVTAITWIRLDDLIQVARETARIGIGRRQPGGWQARLRAAWSAFRVPPALGAAANPKIEHVEYRLREIKPDIPIVIRGREAPPYATRRLWNHFWLVDVQDDEGSAGPHGQAVHIALIQDGQPFMAVSYAPDHDLLCFGRADHGVFIQQRGQPSLRLPCERHSLPGLPSAGLGLSICIALGRQEWEWSTSRPLHQAQLMTPALFAAHLGYTCSEYATGRPLQFNTPDWMLAGIRFSSRRAGATP